MISDAKKRICEELFCYDIPIFTRKIITKEKINVNENDEAHVDHLSWRE